MGGGAVFPLRARLEFGLIAYFQTSMCGGVWRELGAGGSWLVVGRSTNTPPTIFKMTLNHENVGNNNNIVVDPKLERDLKLLSKWVKEELFKVRKFLWKGKEDLGLDQPIFKRFVEQCGGKLEGKPLSEDAARLYIEKVWNVALKDNVVANGLALRRSGVYTVIKNRFDGKCDCV